MGSLRSTIGLLLLAALANGCTCGEGAAIQSDPSVTPSGTGDRTANSGYGSLVESDEFDLNDDEKRALLVLARASVETWVRTSKLIDVPEEMTTRHPKLSKHRACFVTLRRDGQLRGCIGSLEPRRPLADDVRHNAMSAAVHDTRFRPVTEHELASLAYSISVLELPRPLVGVEASDLPRFMGERHPGVILEYRGRRSTFLPSVWDELNDPVEFLSRLCMKQGSPSDCWKEPEMRISTYGSVYFSDKDFR